MIDPKDPASRILRDKPGGTGRCIVPFFLAGGNPHWKPKDPAIQRDSGPYDKPLKLVPSLPPDVPASREESTPSELAPLQRGASKRPTSGEKEEDFDV